MRDVFDYFAVNVLGELHRAFCPAGGAYLAAFTGKGYEERLLAAVAIHSSGAVREDSAVTYSSNVFNISYCKHPY